MARQQAKKTIPVIWDNSCRSIPMCASVIDGIHKMAAKKNCDVKIYADCADLDNDPSASQTVIIVGFESDRLPKQINRLRTMKKQVVVTNMDVDHIDSHCSCATFSRRIATEQMIEFLYNKGCRRFALVGCGWLSVNDMVHSDAMQTYLSHIQQKTHNHTFWYHARILESFDAFYNDASAYDAVLCPNEYAAVAFLHYCEQNSLSVPECFLLATIKGGQISPFCKPSITSFSIDFFAIGVHSVNVWLFLQGSDTNNLQMRITIPGHIVERESTECIPSVFETDLRNFSPEACYQGGPFYKEPTLKSLMCIGSCLQTTDELDRQIIQLLIGSDSYESIAEKLFLCESSLQYRVRKIYKNAAVNDRRSFMKLLRNNFTQQNHFGDR